MWNTGNAFIIVGLLDMHDKIILFNWNMVNHLAGEQWNHMTIMALVLANQLEKLVCEDLT
jgi:hypothetical protein